MLGNYVESAADLRKGQKYDFDPDTQSLLKEVDQYASRIEQKVNAARIANEEKEREGKLAARKKAAADRRRQQQEEEERASAQHGHGHGGVPPSLHNISGQVLLKNPKGCIPAEVGSSAQNIQLSVKCDKAGLKGSPIGR